MVTSNKEDRSCIGERRPLVKSVCHCGLCADRRGNTFLPVQLFNWFSQLLEPDLGGQLLTWQSNLFDCTGEWKAFSGKRFTGNGIFRHELQDDYLKSKPHVAGKLFSLTRALLGLRIFHRQLGGGVWTPPPPMISAPGRRRKKNESRRSKAREKSFRNHFDHFLAQVKIEVTRGQN